MKLLVFIAAAALFHLGCQNAKVSAPPPLPPQTETAKPERIAVSRVAVIAFSELSHLERAMKPYFGLELSADTTKDCRKSITSKPSLRKTEWKCVFRDTTSGRKEINGRENVDLDQDKVSLTYDSRFETRIFDDNEAPDKAHTVLSTRKMKIHFDRTSATPSTARFTIASRTYRLGATSERRGSDWTMSLSGTLKLVGGEWFVLRGSTISMKGALFGDDGERLTMWASGDFNFVSKNETRLSGLSASSSCTKPDVGSWNVRAVGGGENFDTEVDLSSTGVEESSGPALNWPYDFCERP